MDNLLAARMLMATSLGFHIVFAAIGMAMPFLMAAAHYLYLKHRRNEALELTHMWSKGVAIFFATGAVSGTVLSFELGLLWPGFMRWAGPIIGMPFSWEGSAFFLESIFLGIFLYGWGKISPWLHWLCGVLVGICGFASGIFVLAANSWMNTPQGFDWVNGVALNIDPIQAAFNPAWFHQSLHMQLAAFEAVGFSVAGIHAWLLLKGRRPALNRLAILIAMAMGGGASILQPFSGHLSAQRVAIYQPAKLAAMEAHFKTEKGASLILGGIPNEETGSVSFALRIPKILSFLATNDLNGEVKGLDQIAKENWPPVAVCHYAFQVMILIGTLLAVYSVIYFFLLWKKRNLSKGMVSALVGFTPLGFITMEAGWTVTEVGRQPWIIYGILKTSQAVTPMPGTVFHFAVFGVLYLILAFLSSYLLWRQIRATQGAGT